MSIVDENPYDLPLDDPELVAALLPELPPDALGWLLARTEAAIAALQGERQRRARERLTG